MVMAVSARRSPAQRRTCGTGETHLLSGPLVFRAALDFYIQMYAGFMRFYFFGGCVYLELFIEIYIRFFLTYVFFYLSMSSK